MSQSQLHRHFALDTTWQELTSASKRAGLILQNRSTNTQIILVCEGKPADENDAIELLIGEKIYEDIRPMRGALWAKCVAGTGILTVVEKF